MPSSEDVELHPNFQRGMFQLERQIETANDMVVIWKVYGAHAGGCGMDKMNPWWQGLTSIENVL